MSFQCFLYFLIAAAITASISWVFSAYLRAKIAFIESLLSQ